MGRMKFYSKRRHARHGRAHKSNTYKISRGGYRL